MNSKLKKGMFYVLVASIVNLIFRLFTNFMLPKFLSIESYATLKTYQLYISYAGLFAFGYIDGMYLEYGGKELTQINSKKIAENLSICRILQISVAVLFFVISITMKSEMLMLFSISLISTNLISYFHNLYQATGQFKSYSKITSFTSIFTFLINVILLFVFKLDNAKYYIIGYVILNTIVWIALEIKTYKVLKKIDLFYFSLKKFLKEAKDGILLTLGQFSSTILSGLDRWFVKFLMDTLAFAEYSFGVSVEGFLTIAITPITVTLYNGFCKNNEKEYVNRLFEIVVLFAVFLISVAFGVKFILEKFLQKYFESSNIIFILFAAQIYYIIIKSIFVNLYKANKKQKQYFIKLVIVIFLGAINNLILYCLNPLKESFAFGTLICAIEWMILCLKDFKDYSFKRKGYVFIFCETIIFILLGVYSGSIIGFALYIIITLVLSLIFMKDTFIYLIEMCINYCKRKLLEK